MSRSITLCMLAIGGVALGACATTPTGTHGANRSPYLGEVRVASLAEAHHFGQRLTGYYSDGFERSNSVRRWFNIGIWAASTYTAGAAGLGAHADNTFVGALTGSALSGLEPLVNEGGPEAWIHGLGKTVCLSRTAYSGLDPETTRAASILESLENGNAASQRELEALGAYRGTYMAVMNGYDQAYSEFLTRRVGQPLSATALAEMVAGARTDAGPNPAEEAPDPAATEAAAIQTATEIAALEAGTLPAAERAMVGRILSGELLLQTPNQEKQTFAAFARDEVRASVLGERAQLAADQPLTTAPPEGEPRTIPPAVRAALQRALTQVREDLRGQTRISEQAAAEAAARVETANAMIARQINFCLGSSAS